MVNKKPIYRIAQDKDNLSKDCRLARGLTWSQDTIDEAYASYKKMFPACVIAKVVK